MRAKAYPSRSFLFGTRAIGAEIAGKERSASSPRRKQGRFTDWN